MRVRLRVRLAAALVTLAALVHGGCHRGRGATCDKVGTRFLALAQADLAADTTVDAATRRAVAGVLPPMRDAMVRACREDAWAAEVRACFVEAADKQSFQACRDRLTDRQREKLRAKPAEGTGATP